jgi:hypothetical protein
MFALPEKITIWRVTANDGFGGKTWSTPVTLDARIAFKQEKFTDVNGDTAISTAVVYTDGDMQLDDKVFFGESASASPVVAANDVRALSSTPSGTDLVKGWF